MDPKHITVFTCPAAKFHFNGGERPGLFVPASFEHVLSYVIEIDAGIAPGIYNFWIVAEPNRFLLAADVEIGSTMPGGLKLQGFGPHFEIFNVEIHPQLPLKSDPGPG